MSKTLLRQERERRGWSRGYIAEQVEVDVITVGRWERGERLPHPHYRQKLCALFAMNAEELGLLPEMFQKHDETGSTPDTNEQAAAEIDEALALSATESASVVDEPASSPQSNIAGIVSRQRRTFLLGLGGLGAASLAAIGVFYVRNLTSASAHLLSQALVLPGQPLAQLSDPTSPTGWVNRMAWSANGSQIAVANGAPHVTVWNIAQEQIQLFYPTLNQWVNDVSWSKTNWIAAANATKDNSVQGSGSVQIWKFPESTLVWTLPCHYAVRSVSWSPDGTMLAISGHTATVEIWNPFTVTQLSQYAYPALGQQGISRVKWSPDGTLLACATDDGSVHVWKALERTALNIYRGHKVRVVDLAWSPDGKYITSGSEDHTARVWNALNGQTLLVYRGHTNNIESIDWSPQNTYIASGSADSTIQIWEAQTGKLKMKYEIPNDIVETLIWSQDGRRIAAGTSSQGTWIW